MNNEVANPFEYIEKRVAELVRQVEYAHDEIALQSLILIGDSAVPSLIRSWKETPDVWIFQEIPKALAKIGKSALPGLVELLNDPEIDLSRRLSAAETIIKIGVSVDEVITGLRELALVIILPKNWTAC